MENGLSSFSFIGAELAGSATRKNHRLNLGVWW
jgi:hypothetical protein